jgi:hypothetical protein
MISQLALHRAARAHLLTLSAYRVHGNGLAATTGGYIKTAGSFLSAGYAVGMEITAAGFSASTNNGTAIVTGVAAQLLQVNKALTVEAHNAQMDITVQLPTRRVWQLTDLTPAYPTNGAPWIADRWTPGPVTQTAISATGFFEFTPQYTVTVYGASGKGVDVLAGYADALTQHFPVGLSLTGADGVVAHVRSDTGPFISSILPDQTAGFAFVSVTIPLRVEARGILP